MSDKVCLPYFAQGPVVKGFGRGSKDLGIPTANFPDDVVSQLPANLKCGVYYGWACVDGISGVHKMVLSVGWNVFYGNDVKTMETHIIKQFDQDFYGDNLKVIILGFIRPMCNFDSLDALITAIHNDIRVSNEELSKPENLSFQSDAFFVSASPAPSEEKQSSLTDKTISNGCHTEHGCVLNSNLDADSNVCIIQSRPTSKCMNSETAKSSDICAQQNSTESGTLPVGNNKHNSSEEKSI